MSKYFTIINKEDALNLIENNAKRIDAEMFCIPNDFEVNDVNRLDEKCFQTWGIDVKKGKEVKHMWITSKAMDRFPNGESNGLINNDECRSSWGDHGIPEDLYKEDLWNVNPGKWHHRGGLFPNYFPTEVLEGIKDEDTLYLFHEREDGKYVFCLKANQSGGRYKGFGSFEDLVKRTKIRNESK